jgi:hypothetical protein
MCRQGAWAKRKLGNICKGIHFGKPHITTHCSYRHSIQHESLKNMKCCNIYHPQNTQEICTKSGLVPYQTVCISDPQRPSTEQRQPICTLRGLCTGGLGANDCSCARVSIHADLDSAYNKWENLSACRHWKIGVVPCAPFLVVVLLCPSTVTSETEMADWEGTLFYSHT